MKKWLERLIPLTTPIAIITSVLIAIGVYKEGILLFGDTDLTYHFGKNFFSLSDLFLWNDYFKGGIFDFDKFQAFYLKKIIFFIRSVTNLYFFSYLWYMLPILGYITSFFYFIREIEIKFQLDINRNRLRLTAIILSIFAATNGIFFIYYGQVLFILSLIMLNLFLLFFIKNIASLINNGKNNYKFVIICGIFLSQINIYLHTSFLLLYAFSILFILNYKFVLKNWRAFSLQALVLGSIVIFLNAQWLIPVFFQSILNSTSIKNLIIYDTQLGWEQAKSISNNIFMTDLLKIKSYHIFNNYPLFYNFFYIVPFGIVLYFLAKKRKKIGFIFPNFFIFFLISIFLSLGIKPGSEPFFKILWEDLPFFTAFRTIFKFSFLFLYSLIIILVYILARIRRKLDYTVIILLLLINVVFSFFYYFQPEARRNLEQYKIPEYYFQLQAANLSENTKKIGNNITSPQFNWQFQYQWAPEKIDSMNILPYFYGRGVLINGAQDTPDVPYIYNDYFDYSMRNNRTNTLRNLLALRNIKYITFQDDLRVTNDESTPFIVKSNLEETPKYKKVITDKFKDEICSKMIHFEKISLCQIKNSLFSPLFKIKNSNIINIRGGEYLSALSEGNYFVPFKNRSEKSHSQINLVEENPLILNDLMKLKITEPDDVRFFGNLDESKFVEGFSNRIDVYPTLKPLQVKNCFYQLGCSLFPLQNIKPGQYALYFVRYLDPNQPLEDKEFSVKIFDDVNENFITSNIENLKNSKDIVDISSDKFQNINFLSKEFNSLGEINLTGGNVILRTLSDQFFLEGRFYLIRKNQENAVPPAINEKTTIEFKKINPTKFRVRIHGAAGKIPLIFQENFNKNWRLYSSEHVNSAVSNTGAYRILAGNEDDQANRTELGDYISKGWVTALGDGKEKIIEHKRWNSADQKEELDYKEKYSIDFISKNFQGTIQNNNLPDGQIWETWFKKSIDETGIHFENDGYANGWVVNTEKICQDESACIKNPDGSYDVELVLEFWPQRLLYVGLAISMLTFFGCIIFIIIPKKRNNSQI